MRAQGDSAKVPRSEESAQPAEDCRTDCCLTHNVLNNRTDSSKSRTEESFLRQLIPALLRALGVWPT